MTLGRVTRLYPQYQRSVDRRQQNIPVAIERRSGTDRRGADRVQLDSRLQKDIFEVKNQVSKLEAMAPKLFEHNVTTNAPTFTSMNNMTQDTFYKQSRVENNTQSNTKDDASMPFKIGVIAAALACAVGLSYLSVAGAVIAIGTTLYIGSRVLKTVIEKEVKDDNKK